MTNSYHYEYFAYANNLCYGRMLLGHSATAKGARAIGERANRGAFDIERHKVYTRKEAAK